MADLKTPNHHHIIEILADLQDHPLMEISESPGHLLLLNLFQREEHLFNNRITRKETRIGSLRTEIFNLCLYFFTFQLFFFTILSTSLFETETETETNQSTCKQWWIPMVLNLSTSFMMVVLVHVNLCRYWKVYDQMQKERTGSRALTRCIQELRMKGVSFDLSKGPANGNLMKMKSSSVEIKWKPLTWCKQYLITVCFVGVMGLAIPVSRFMVCV